MPIKGEYIPQIHNTYSYWEPTPDQGDNIKSD